MGFLGQSNEHKPVKQLSDEKKYVFSYTNDIDVMAQEIMDIEGIMDSYIEVFDIAWQARYSKKMNQENSDNYRSIINGEIVIPEPLKIQLAKLVDARMKNDIINKQTKKQKRRERKNKQQENF